MPRVSRLTPLVAPVAVALLIALLLLPAMGGAQEQPDPAPPVGAQQPTQRPKRVAPDEEGLLVFSIVETMPAAPAYVRLLRIGLEPGASSPLHFHPGPEIALVETGVLTAEVEGPADLLPRGRTKPVPADEGTSLSLEPGDQLLYAMDTPMTFQNAEEEGLTAILTAVILAGGHQHPPGLTWVNGPPAANALQGVRNFVFGDGCATTLPEGPVSVAIERLILEDGEPIPAYTGPVMLALEAGTLEFETVSGEIQVVPAGVDPCETGLVEPGTSFTFNPGNSAFFPTGVAEVERPEGSGTISLLRLTIAPLPPLPDSGTPAATPLPEAVEAAAVIEVAAPATPVAQPTATPEPTEESEAEPTEEPEEDEEPTEEPADDFYPVGATVEVNDVDVNLRSEPTTSADVVAVLDQGFQMTVTGDPVEADGLLWYPVAAVDDPGVAGWIAGQFLNLVEE